MTNFYVTFGQQYAREPHPTCPGAHPDGWLQVEAGTEDAARQLVTDVIGRHWAFIYDERPSLALFSRGCIGVVTEGRGLTTRWSGIRADEKWVGLNVTRIERLRERLRSLHDSGYGDAMSCETCDVLDFLDDLVAPGDAHERAHP
jgi:hypothetical protein